MERLRSGTGTSELDDARQAGQAAASAAADMLRTNAPDGAVPALIMVYASVRYDLVELLAGVRSVTGSTPLAGLTSCGHFAAETVTGPGLGVAVLVLGGGDYVFGVASAAGLRTEPEAVGKTVARGAKAAARTAAETAGRPSEDLPYAALVLLTDGIGSDQQAVLSGVHRVCGAAIPVVGGTAGDDRQMKQTSVFHDGETLTDAAVAIWISSPRPLTVTSAHGWKPVSLPLLITRTDGLVVQEIAGRPAGEVFLELASAVSDAPVLPDSETWQSAYALGLIEPDGSHLIRGVFVTADGTMSTFTPLPAYGAVQVMTADPDTLLSVIDGVIAAALVYGDESVLLAFDCIARMDILGEKYPDEIARINRAAGAVVPFGSYTYGEFARAKGIGGMHNATLTTLAL